MAIESDFNAAPRQRLLALGAALLEALYDPAAVAVLATLKPGDMRPGGARVPGTSYELEAPRAARVMGELLALRGVRADALLQALAHADVQARYAVIAGQAPPSLAALYPHCTRDIGAPGSESMEAAVHAVAAAAQKLFTPSQSRRIAALCQQLRQRPALLDSMAVQQFIASFVRNSP